MLRPHPPGTFIRTWQQARAIDEHSLMIHMHGAKLRCKYCNPFWERGLYQGLPYRIDIRNGWWEYDAGECECIYFTKDGTMMNWRKQFYAVTHKRTAPGLHITVHVCDLPSGLGVLDMQDDLISWNDILSMVSLRKLCRSFLPRFQARLHEQHKDKIARYLLMRDWTRTRLCNYALNAVVCNTDVMVTKFSPAQFCTRHDCQVRISAK